jgi:hypothetical protein
MRKPQYIDPATVVALGIAARGWMLFSTSLVPGINGAYYLVQARSLLEKGSLAIPDFPLTFFLHAFFAKVLQVLSGSPPEITVLWATKLTDAILPPLAAIPVYLIIRSWKATRVGRDSLDNSNASEDDRGGSRWIALGAAAVVALGAPALSMVGDFQKNSVALLWLAGFIYASRRFLSGEDTSRKRATGGIALGFLVLIGLTHVGVFGSALVLACGIVAAHVLVSSGIPWRRIAVPGATAVLALVLVSGVITWRFDPARVRRLVHAFSDPEQFLSAGNALGLPPGGPPGFDGAGVPILLGLIRFVPFVVVGGIGILALVSAWRRRKQTPEDAAMVMGSGATAILLAGPWFSFDVAMRLVLIAAIPTIVALAYVLVQVRRRWVRVIGGIVPLILLVGAGIPQIAGGGRAIISTDEYRELQAMRETVPASDRTLVVTRHGLEWWSAWVLHTHVAQAQAVRTEDWQQFERVLFLEAKNGLQFPGPGRVGAAGPRPLPGFPGPPPGLAAGPMLPPGGLLPMMGAPIPPDAEIVYEGINLKLARVRTPPEFVAKNVH